ncbi:MAG: hypothetical protein KGO49_01835 [Gammaproteobacteria bacterium]|nr:hypothetical protein [Gammaproteobacteria bacterium]
MSWHRDYVFFTKKNLPLSIDWSEDLVEKNVLDEMELNFHSRSDVFGDIVRDIIHHFDDLTALHFFQERNEADVADSCKAYKELFEKRLVTFDYQQQTQVVDAIKKIFQYTKTQPTIFEEWAYEFFSDSLEDQLHEAESVTLDDFKSNDDNDTFGATMVILRLIMDLFNKSLEKKQYVGFYEYIP